jgi:hypothetical protein
MPAITTALVPALEAAVPTIVPAQPQAAKLAPQTFTSLLGTLIENETTPTQAATPKKLSADLDCYTALATHPSARPAQPVFVPTTLRMHFFFPAAPSAKVGTEVKSGNDDDSNPNTGATSPAITPTAPMPPVETQPVPTLPVALLPVLTPQPVTLQSQTLQTATTPLPTTHETTPQPVSVSRRTVPAAGATHAPATHAPAAAQNAPSSDPAVILMTQPVDPQSPGPNSTVEPKGGTSPAAAQPSVVHTSQNSAHDTLNISPKDSVAPQFSVNPEGSKPLPQTELAFAARLTVANDAQLAEHVPVSVAAPGSSPSIKPPAAAATATIPSVTPEPKEQQADTNGNGDPTQTQKELPKPQVRAQMSSAPEIPQASVTQNALSLPQTGLATLPTASASPVTELNAQPSNVKTVADVSVPSVDARPAAAAIPATDGTPKSEPVRDLSIRIGDSPGNQVDVKIQERGGEVHVAVLSSSPSLNNDLRQQVGDLVGKLDRAGYHAETFKPSTSTTSQQASNQSDAGQQQSSPGSQQQQQEEARQQFVGRQKKTNPSQWLAQMNGGFDRFVTEGIEKQ